MPRNSIFRIGPGCIGRARIFREIVGATVLSLVLVFPALASGIGPHKSPVIRKNPISLEITTHLGDNQKFVDGDTISFFVSLDKDAYLLIIYQTADKKLIQILPNSYQKKNYYHRGEFIQVPDDDQQFNFKVSPPFGHEKIMAYASTRPFPFLPGITTKRGLTILDGTIGEVIGKLRLHGRHSGAYGEATLNLITGSRK